MNLQPILDVAGGVHHSVCTIVNERPRRLNTRTGGEMSNVEWILIAFFRSPGVWLGHRTCVNDFDL